MSEQIGRIVYYESEGWTLFSTEDHHIRALCTEKSKDRKPAQHWICYNNAEDISHPNRETTTDDDKESVNQKLEENVSKMILSK